MRALKIYLTAILGLLATFAAQSQSIYDALRFSNNDYEGTARGVAMGNAFTALGGDMGAITINPASSGVYLYNEFTITPAVTNAVDRSHYLGSDTKADRTRFTLSNVGGVSSFKTGRNTGLVSFNMGVVANQTSNYSTRSFVSGRQTLTSKLGSMAAAMSNSNIYCDDMTISSSDPTYPFYGTNALWEEVLAWNTALVETIYDDYTYVGATENILSENGQDIIVLGGPLTQSYLQETTGYKQDITLNFGGNISHKLYFGINFTMQTLWYDKFQKLSEKGENPDDFQTEFEEFTHTYRESTNGIGFNIKAGIIYRPVAGLRLGATISTPTWTRLKNENFETMDARVYQEHYYEESPLNVFQYDITSPLRWGLGVAYTFGSVALISIDYENTNYGSIKFKTDNSMHPADVEYYNKANSAIRTNFKRVNNVRAGMEIKPVQQLSLRFGYNYYDSSEKYFDGDIHYASAGIGFTTKSNIFMDLAYRQQCNWLSEDYELYDTQYIPGLPETLVNSKYMNWKLLFTFGCRF